MLTGNDNNTVSVSNNQIPGINQHTGTGYGEIIGFYYQSAWPYTPGAISIAAVNRNFPGFYDLISIPGTTVCDDARKSILSPPKAVIGTNIAAFKNTIDIHNHHITGFA